jgi:hypothetical protein
MPRGLSSTVLPARAVEVASAKALAGLREERQAVKATAMADHRRRHPVAALLGLEPPQEIKYLWEEFRKHDETCLEALQALAGAALDANPLFTVEMTADDFRLLSPFYEVLRK